MNYWTARQMTYWSICILHHIIQGTRKGDLSKQSRAYSCWLSHHLFRVRQTALQEKIHQSLTVSTIVVTSSLLPIIRLSIRVVKLLDWRPTGNLPSPMTSKLCLVCHKLVWVLRRNRRHHSTVDWIPAFCSADSSKLFRRTIKSSFSP